MNLHNLKYLYIRADEIPFSSEHKYMAVKCTPRYGQVSDAHVTVASTWL